MNAVAGRRPDGVKLEPFRFDQMRPGCCDVDARVADMDLGGIWAMLNFPSQITGFCGPVFADADADAVVVVVVVVVEVGIVVAADAWGHLPPDELRKLCCENAADLYRHPLPEVVLPVG